MLVYLGIDQSKAYGAEVDGQQIEKVEYWYESCQVDMSNK